MEASDAIKAIKAEVKWCSANRGARYPEFEEGYVAGLAQAVLILKSHPVAAEFGRRGGSARVPKGFAKSGKASEAGRKGAEKRWQA